MSKKVIYLVNQTQPAEGYYETTIYACSTFERAQKYVRRLNKEYGEFCVFDKNWDFVECDMQGEPHYYTVAEAEIDEPMIFPDESVLEEELEQIQGGTNDADRLG